MDAMVGLPFITDIAINSALYKWGQNSHLLFQYLTPGVIVT